MARYARRTRRTSRSTYRRSAPRSYGRRRPVRRASRRRTSAGRATRIVIQVVGGPAGVASSPLALGMKGNRPVRARY